MAQLSRLKGSPWQNLQNEQWIRLMDDLRPIRDRAKRLYHSITVEEYIENESNITAVSELAEDLRDILLEYWMAQQQAIYDQNCRLIDEADLSVLNGCRRAQGSEYCHGNRRGCLKGTRNTVLSEIQSWVKDLDKSPVFWLNGLAGTGKSTIAQTVAERLFAEDRLGASFFCSRDFEDRSNLHFIFPTLAFQLARKHSDFRSSFMSLLRSNPDIVHESLYSQMQRLIVEPLRTTGVSMVIVVDALDECKDEEPSSAILSVLGRFVEQIPRVKFFITGRPEPRIRSGFRLPLLVNSTDVFVLHNVHPSLINSDIRLFLERELSELARRHQMREWPSDGQIDLLCRRAAGLFIYAVATVKFLDNKTRTPRHQLGVILKLPESTVPEGKTKFDSKTTVDSLYTSILQAAFDEEDPDIDSNIRMTIGAVVLVVNPLPPSAIAQLIGLDPEEVTMLLTLIQSLLSTGEDSDKPVKPFHKSFPEFIVDPSRCTNPRFCVLPGLLHTELAINYLRLMNEGLERNLLLLPEYSINSEVKDLQARIGDRLSVALQYACRSWHSHLTETKRDTRNARGHLRVFLHTKLLEWLEVLSVLGEVGGAVVALQRLMAWLEQVGWHQFMGITKDCFSFVTKFFEPIHVSATHIYHSALELCPTSSAIRAQYYGRYNRINQLPRVIVGASDSWDPTVSVSGEHYDYGSCTWSPCDRFIAAQMGNVIEIRNPLTLYPLTIFQSTETFQLKGPLAYSPECGSLACAVDGGIVIWDIQTGGVANEVRCGTNNVSLAWSLDGCEICVINRNNEALSVRVHNITSGTTLYPGELRSDDNPHLWACEDSFQVITTARDYVAVTIKIFDVGHALVNIKSFRLRWNRPTANPVISFSPTTRRVSVCANSVLYVFGDWSAICLLKGSGYDYSFLSFSPDGRLFGAFVGGVVRVWKYTSDEYRLWKRFKCPGWTDPSFQFSSTSSLLLGRFRSILQVWRLDDLHATPKNNRERRAGILRSGNHIATARKSEETVTIIGSHSEASFQSIDTGVQIEELAITGNTLLVVGLREVVAWVLTEGGLVDGASGGRADRSNSIWTLPMKPLAVLRVEGKIGGVESDRNTRFTFHTETGEPLPHEQAPGHFSASWSLLTRPLRGRDYLHCHNLHQANTFPDYGYQRGSQVTLQGEWVKDPGGQHKLWIPVEWRKVWDPVDWHPDTRIQFSVVGGEPIIIKF